MKNGKRKDNINIAYNLSIFHSFNLKYEACFAYMEAKFF